jgi:hypothetical protein
MFTNANIFRKALLLWAQFAACLFILARPLFAGERLALEVREMGGFRRHEPVSALITLPQAVPRDTPFRLLTDGAPVVAQFRPAGDDVQSAKWWVDFSTILSPHEVRNYVVEYGSDVQPVAESKNGHVLRETKDAFVIENAPYITWTVPRDLAGFLRSVDFPPNQHLRAESPGLVLKDRSGGRHPLGGPGVESHVVRSGTRAVALRYTGTFDQDALTRVRWTVDLTFPSPVSWVEVLCTVDDPEGKVAAVGAELNLALDAPKADAPTLVDFGAWTLVYAALASHEIAELRGSPSPAVPASDSRAKPGLEAQGRAVRCGVFRGTPEKLLPVATNYDDSPTADAPGPVPAVAEGWLHVMDRRRCLALAVDQFAKDANDSLAVSGDGEVRVWRDYSVATAQTPPFTTKSLRTWLHFVHYPPQHSAATSPRMMQTPSRVVVKPR